MNLPAGLFVIASINRIVTLIFCQFFIASINHIVNLSKCQAAIVSTYYLLNFLFDHLRLIHCRNWMVRFQPPRLGLDPNLGVIGGPMGVVLALQPQACKLGKTFQPKLIYHPWFSRGIVWLKMNLLLETMIGLLNNIVRLNRHSKVRSNL